MSSFWSGFPLIQAGLKRIKVRFEAFAKQLPTEFQSELRPYLQREGKSLRAGLLLLAAGPVSDPQVQERLETTAAAVELLHLATLIHDDIVDQASLRRGEPSLNVQLGSQKAVLYGDLLLSACFRLVTEHLEPEQAHQLAQLAFVMAGTEILQLHDRFRPPHSRRRILRKMMGKTALLFSLSLFVGAKISGRPEQECRWLRRAGYALGMAFQLQDDWLDWTASQQQLGKPVLEDLTNGIYTWPVALAWQTNPQQTESDLADVRSGQISARDLQARWQTQPFWLQTPLLIQNYFDRAQGDLARSMTPADLHQVWQPLIDRLIWRQS